MRYQLPFKAARVSIWRPSAEKIKLKKGFLKLYVCHYVLSFYVLENLKKGRAEAGREKEKGNNVIHKKERLVLSKGPGPGSTPTSTRR